MPEAREVKKLGEIATSQYGFTASGEQAEVGPRFLRITDNRINPRVRRRSLFLQAIDLELVMWPIFARAGLETRPTFDDHSIMVSSKLTFTRIGG